MKKRHKTENLTEKGHNTVIKKRHKNVNLMIKSGKLVKKVTNQCKKDVNY